MSGGTTTLASVVHLVIGPEEHGVVEYALRSQAALETLANDAGRRGSEEAGRNPAPGLNSGPRLLRVASWEELDEQIVAEALNAVTSMDQGANPASVATLHVCFTDHLFSPTPHEAVERVTRLAQGRRLSVSFHDIPQIQEGRERFEERAAAYTRLGDRADVLAVNSRHEAAFFTERCADAQPVVIPLPLPEVVGVASDAEVGSRADAGGPVVAVMGFVYPGKGHRELIEALAGTGATVRALGGLSEGHDWLRDQLETAAREAGIEFELTGYLAENELEQEMLAADVPVCAHRHFSASGSLMKWISLGRRVLVADSPYARELAETWGEHIVPVKDDRWAEAIAALPADFSRRVPPAHSWAWADVAAAYARAWTGADHGEGRA